MLFLLEKIMLIHRQLPVSTARRYLIRRKRGPRLVKVFLRLASLRCLSSGLRILGICICVCTLVNLIVYLTLSRFMDLITNPELIRGDSKLLTRNLTWHIGPNLIEDDRRAIVVYGYPFTDSSFAEEYLISHPRIAWFTEDMIERFITKSRLSRTNITNMAAELFNCSAQALPLFLELVNNETASRREVQWCFPPRGRGSGGDRTTSRGASSTEIVRSSCRQVNRKQLKSFCLQHHVAIKMSRTPTLQQVLSLPVNHLKVLHLLDQPIITRNQTKRLLFSARTQRLRRFYKRVIIKSKQKHSCYRLTHDMNFITSSDEYSMGDSWRYQRFPIECFIMSPINCALEMFNFLDIYVPDDVIRRSGMYGNASSTDVTVIPNQPSFDMSKLAEEDSLDKLKGIAKYVCQGEKHSL